MRREGKSHHGSALIACLIRRESHITAPRTRLAEAERRTLLAPPHIALGVRVSVSCEVCLLHRRRRGEWSAEQ